MDEVDQDHVEFLRMAANVQTFAKIFLEDQFGLRCSSFEPDCECCKRWAALDVLLKDPWAEEV